MATPRASWLCPLCCKVHSRSIPSRAGILLAFSTHPASKEKGCMGTLRAPQGCPESSPGFSNKTNNFPTSLYRAVGMTMGKTTRQSCSQTVPSVGSGCYCPVATSLSPLLYEHLSQGHAHLLLLLCTPPATPALTEADKALH